MCCRRPPLSHPHMSCLLSSLVYMSTFSQHQTPVGGAEAGILRWFVCMEDRNIQFHSGVVHYATCFMVPDLVSDAPLLFYSGNIASSRIYVLHGWCGMLPKKFCSQWFFDLFFLTCLALNWIFWLLAMFVIWIWSFSLPMVLWPLVSHLPCLDWIFWLLVMFVIWVWSFGSRF